MSGELSRAAAWLVRRGVLTAGEAAANEDALNYAATILVDAEASLDAEEGLSLAASIIADACPPGKSFARNDCDALAAWLRGGDGAGGASASAAGGATDASSAAGAPGSSNVEAIRDGAAPDREIERPPSPLPGSGDPAAGPAGFSVAELLAREAAEALRAREAQEAARRERQLADADFGEAKARIVGRFAHEFDDTVEITNDGRIASGLAGANISRRLVRRTADEAAAAAAADAELWRNDNSLKVLQAAQAERERSRLERQKEQERIQLQKKQEATKKEDEKRRVSRKERRTGR